MEYTNKIEIKRQAIIAYGNGILRKKCIDISKDEEGLDLLIRNLWKTMELSGGVGLAAPQINNTHKVFVVNSKIMFDDLSDLQQKSIFSGDKGIEETFINAKIINGSEEKWNEMEGCLSIPGINEPVMRSWDIIVEYQNERFENKRKQFSGYTAKVIQHEYDHINGVLFIDHLPALTKKIIKSRLKRARDGKIETNYLIKYVK